MQAMDSNTQINLQGRNIFLIPSSGFMVMGYKNYNLHYNWIGTSFGHNLGHALEFGMCQTYV